LSLEGSALAAAAAVPKDVNASMIKFAAAKPEIAPDRYRELPPELGDALGAFCRKHGYKAPKERL
jgi:hypothetical protein